jgi:hypothetical protein
MADKPLYERVQDAISQLIATGVGGATGYYAGRKIEEAGGGAAGVAVGGLLASTAAKNLANEALRRLNQVSNPSDQAIRDMLTELYTTQSPLHQMVEAHRAGNG